MQQSLRAFDSIDWAAAAGRLHPLVLHLPIGLIIALIWLELVGGWGKAGDEKRRGRGPIVLLLGLSAPSAALTGWLLHESDAYGAPVDWHEYLGIALAGLSLITALCFWRRSRLYPVFLWLSFLLLLPTAHLGATLTHGEEFLLEPFYEEEAPVLDANAGRGPATETGDANTAATVTRAAPAPLEFADILPILEARCTKCHGEKKQRGGLSLHTLEGALLGGDVGVALVLGDADASPMLQRLLLPLDDDDHMPPESKPQPSAAEVEWIRAWIRGEPAPAQPLELRSEDAVDESASGEDDSEDDARLAPVRDAERETRAIATLRARLAHVQPVSSQSDALWIDLGVARLEEGEARALLAPLASRVAELGLSGMKLAASDLEFCAQLPSLTLLDLRRCSAVEGATLDIAPLADSKSLLVLKLAGTPLAASSVDALAKIVSLQRVYLWSTGLEDSVEALAQRRPELQVHGANLELDAPAETEAEVVFEKTSAAASESPVAKAAAGEATSDLVATNSLCPVSGKPVVATFTILYEGHTIGFCCPNCPKSFWEDPATFLSKLDPK